MSEIDALLARSRAPGTFVERRRFTLSRDRAIEKLREFALRDPHQYVLELVQAAVFSEARWIAVDVTPTRLLFAWVGGRPLPEDGLADIFDYLFASHTDAETRPMVQLAIALNAILQRKPKLLRIESGDGTVDGTVRLDLDRKGNAVLGSPEEYLAGTYLLVEFGGRWLPRFPQGGLTEEARLIEERCRYTPVPILLNGSAPFGYRSSRRLRLPVGDSQVPFDDGVRRGVLAFPVRAAEEEEVHIVVGGVWVTSAPAAELTGGPGLTGVICDDGLRKTADQSDIVRDRAWLAMRHAVHAPMVQAVRARRRNFEPPRLPPVPRDEAPTPRRRKKKRKVRVVEAEPIPDAMHRAGSEDSYGLVTLLQFGADEPLFFTTPEPDEALLDALDPARFPYRVLILREGQAISLAEALNRDGITRLTSPGDAEFVRAAMERRPMRVALDLTLELPHGVRVSGLLTLVHHLGGPIPGWGHAFEGQLPMLVALDDVAQLQRRLPLPIRHLSVRFDLTAPATAREDDIAEALLGATIEHGWRLAEALAEHPEHRADFVARLLGAAATPTLVDRGGRTEVELLLPGAWPAGADDLLDVRLGGGRGVTARELAALQGTDEVRTVAWTGAVEALELRLGLGHLTTIQLDRQAVLAVGWARSRWRVLPDWFPREDPRLDLGMVAAILVLPSRRRDPPLPEGWMVVDVLAPGVVQVERDTAPSPRKAWPGGVLRLQQALAKHHERMTLQRPGPTLALRAVTEVRAAERCRQALIGIADGPAARSRALDVAPTLDLFDRTTAVVARFGVPSLDKHVVHLTCDEVRALEQERGARLRLRLDDAPELWRSLRDDADGWLLKEEAHAPGLRAVVGLRDPFDGTTGVMVSGAGGYVTLPELDAKQPCHGIAVLSGGAMQPTDEQRRALLLARERLYRELEVGLDAGRWTGDAEATARAYHEARRGTARRSEQSLARYLSEHLERGATAGRRIERVLRTATGAPLEDHPWSHTLHLGRSHPLVAAADEGEEPARTLLLIEAMRLVTGEDHERFQRGLVYAATVGLG